MGSTVKLQKKMFSLQIPVQLQFSAIAADHLIIMMIRIVLETFMYRMGQTDSTSLSCTGLKPGKPIGCKFPVIAKTPHCDSSTSAFFVIIKQICFWGKKKDRLFLSRSNNFTVMQPCSLWHSGWE